MQPSSHGVPGRQIPQNGHLLEQFCFPFSKSDSFLNCLTLACFPPGAQKIAEMFRLPVLSPENWEQNQAALPSTAAIIKETIVAIAELNSLGNW